MNFSVHLFNFLIKHGKVSVENFGIFYLKNTNAVVESTTNRILPPGKEVAFEPHPIAADNTFAHYLAQEKNIPINDAQAEIQQEVSYWNATIETEGALSLEGLGTFRTDGSQAYFSGLRLENLGPDFYGLEEIKISDIKKSRAVSTEKKPYRFGRTLYWLLPLLMIVGVLGYFAATQPELIFGKKSLLKEKPAAPQPKKQTIIKKDTATVQVISDTLKTDTLAAVKTTSHTWKKLKKASESLTVMTNIVLPNETNSLRNLFGGELLAKMDRCASISAARHCERRVVTASVNHVSFNHPIPEGGIVVLESKVSRAFSTSMEIYVDVWLDDPINQKKIHTNEGIYTFVAVDEFNRPIPIPKIEPETELEHSRYAAAQRRKELSLILSGRMKPTESIELKKLFQDS